MTSVTGRNGQGRKGARLTRAEGVLEREEKEIMSVEQIHCFRFLLLFHLQNG